MSIVHKASTAAVLHVFALEAKPQLPGDLEPRLPISLGRRNAIPVPTHSQGQQLRTSSPVRALTIVYVWPSPSSLRLHMRLGNRQAAKRLVGGRPLVSFLSE